ncbi:MAG: 4Fe-4S binding protein, partial [FCB group bacterium]|nr:4Fe-4S binding protein [FCB group bacterium]
MKATGMQQENTVQVESKKNRGFSTRVFRLWAQILSTAIIVWIGVEFALFVKYIESGGEAAFVARPPGAEGFLPISAMISLRDWFYTGALNTIHPASVVIFVVIVVAALIFKKGFCSWVCPVGFISEMIANIGDKIVRRRLKLPRFLDWPLRTLKYLLLFFFVYAVIVQMSPEAIRQFVDSPYNKVADIKMFEFFVDIDALGFWIIVGLFAFSIFLRGFWCRYLCPYGALLGMISLFGPAKIRRDENLC